MPSVPAFRPSPPSRLASLTSGVPRVGLVAALVLMSVLLTGCLGYDGQLGVSDRDRVSGTVTFYQTLPAGDSGSGSPSSSATASPGTPLPSVGQPVPIPIPLPQPNRPSGASEAPTSGSASAAASSVALPHPRPTADSISVAAYRDGSSVGWTYTYTDATFEEAGAFAPLAERGGALKLRRSGDTVTLTCAIDLRYGDASSPQAALVARNFTGTLVVEFPSAAKVDTGATNGKVDGRRVTWTLAPLQENTLTATVDYPRTDGGSRTSASFLSRKVLGVPVWAALAGVAVLLAVVVLVVVMTRRRRSRRPSPTPPPPAAPATSAPPPVRPTESSEATLPGRPPPLAARIDAAPTVAEPTETPPAAAPEDDVPDEAPNEAPNDAPDDAPGEAPDEASPTGEPAASAARAEDVRAEPAPQLEPVPPVPPAPPEQRDVAAAGVTRRAGWPPPQPSWIDEPGG